MNCSHDDSADKHIVGNSKKLDSIIQKIPANINHVFFISPDSKCLFCDKKIFDLINNDKVLVFSSYDKYRLFLSKKMSANLIEVEESEYKSLFSERYFEFSKYLFVENHQIKWIQNITPQYIDTLLAKINENFKKTDY
ncbi:MAG: hypothetical protein Fur0023_05170 [Bacteroidia bacterium]